MAAQHADPNGRMSVFRPSRDSFQAQIWAENESAPIRDGQKNGMCRRIGSWFLSVSTPTRVDSLRPHVGVALRYWILVQPIYQLEKGPAQLT